MIGPTSFANQHFTTQYLSNPSQCIALLKVIHNTQKERIEPITRGKIIYILLSQTLIIKSE